jgi:hypothetical protein
MSGLCEYLDAFFDNRLSGREHAAFRDHLAACQRCQSDLHELMQLTELAESLASDPDPAAADDDSDPVAIPMCRVRRSRTRLHQACAMAATAAAVLSLCLWRGGAPPASQENRRILPATATKLDPAAVLDAPGWQQRVSVNLRPGDLHDRCSLLERALAEIHAEVFIITETMLMAEVGRAGEHAPWQMETWLVAGLLHTARLRGELAHACAYADELNLRARRDVCEPMQPCHQDQTSQHTERSASPI